MADFRIFNDYELNRKSASDYYICGQRVLEVWNNGKCLGVEFDDDQEGLKGVPKVVFFIDRTQIKLLHDSVPSNNELLEILKQHG